MADHHEKAWSQGSPAEVFSTFLKLGLTSFGGPIAHIGYFRDELVIRRKWLSEQAFGDLVALCQFLPGPASSQTGFALGLMRAGWLGALAAFTAFTLPSALALIIFALAATSISDPLGTGALNGLKIVAVAIVAHAVCGMARNLCPDRERAAIAVAAVAVLAFVPAPFNMVAAIAAGAMAGAVLGRGSGNSESGHVTVAVPRSVAVSALLTFASLLVILPLLAGQSQAIAVFDGFYRAGALVFGGGHVVLPLLEAEVVGSGWVTQSQFLAGYGAAQAVPGPLFTFAAYLGATLQPAPTGILGAFVALTAVFLPGFLILVGVLPFWDRFRRMEWTQSLMQGANAAVVGILGAALYSPVFIGSITNMKEFTLALACFVLLLLWKAPPWVVVLLAGAGGMVLTLVP